MKQGVTLFTPIIVSLPKPVNTSAHRFDYRVQEIVLASKPHAGLIEYSTNGDIRTITTNSLIDHAYVTRRAAQRAADVARKAVFVIKDNQVELEYAKY